MGFLYRLRVGQQAVDVGVFAVEDGSFLRPDGAHGVDVFVGDGAALGERGGRYRVEFDFQPAGADADDEAAAGQDVDRGEHFRCEDGGAVGDDHHGKHDFDPGGFGGDPGGGGELLDAVAGIRGVEFARWGIGIARGGGVRQGDVVGEGEVVEAEGFSQLGDVRP